MARAFDRLPAQVRYRVYARQLRERTTPAENVFRAHLDTLGVAYRMQHGFHEFNRVVDFYLRDHNLVIEIDGPYHDPSKDRARDEAFTNACGIRVLRLTNERVLSGDMPDLLLCAPKTA